MVRACAAFKAAVCLADPFEQTGRRAILNLGHTFAHALEAASGFELRHGDAVALGLLAALRLSGLETDVVDELLRPEPVRGRRGRARGRRFGGTRRPLTAVRASSSSRRSGSRSSRSSCPTRTSGASSTL